MTPRQVRIHLTRIQDRLNALRGELEDRLGFFLRLRAAAARASRVTSKK